MAMAVAGFLAVLCCTSAAATDIIKFYMHDILIAEPNRPVSAVNVTTATNTINFFGAVVLFDDKITNTPSYNSEEIGQGRGIYAVDSMANYISFLFTWTAELQLPGNLNGTLCFFGQDRISLPVRQIGVFGCGGAFVGGPLIATISTFSSSSGGFNVVLEISVPLKQLLKLPF